MRYPTTPDALRRRRLLVAGVALTLFVAACIAYVVLSHGSTSARSPDPATEPGRRATVTTSTDRPADLPRLRPTSDPETFARAVATALFAWDTTSMVGRADHVEQLAAVADPTGESTSGLLSDLDNYLPTPEAWVELAQYATRQWLTIDSVETPSQWAEAQAQADDGLLPGTTAFTIRGVRHRSGVWEDAPITTAHDVAFTVFIVCGPSYPQCHLLRLSLLDEPLD